MELSVTDQVLLVIAMLLLLILFLLAYICGKLSSFVSIWIDRNGE